MRTIKPMLALALALAGGGTFAQSVQVADSAFQRFLINTTGVGQQTVAFTGTGQPVSQVSGHTLAPDGSPGVRASATGVLRNGAGGQIPVSLTGRVTPAVVARFIGRAVPLLGAAVLASDIADFASEQGFQLGYSDGSVTVQKPDPSACTSNCYTFTGQICSTFLSYPSIGSFASAYKAGGDACLGYNSGRIVSVGQLSFVIERYNSSGGVIDAVTITPSRTSRPADQAAFLPSSLGEFEQFLLQGNPYPVSSSVAEAIVEARELLGEPIPLAQPQVTGPASSPGSTSTSTKADGSTVTITQTFNHTYNGPNISTTTTTTTSTVPVGGGPVQTETTVETPDPVQQEPEPFVMPCGVPGSPPCSVKVDETGMPTADDVNADRLKDAEDEFRSWLEGIAAANPFPDIPWDFALPTDCGVIPTPAFSPALEQIDICQFQPMFHELMTVVWMLGGLFGAISLFMRNSLSQ